MPMTGVALDGYVAVATAIERVRSLAHAMSDSNNKVMTRPTKCINKICLCNNSI